MLTVSNLSKSFGPQELFNDLTWQIDRFRRTALVGPNGAGKSTLLKIIAGEMEPDGGAVLMPKSTRLGYLPQEITTLENAVALELVLSGRQDLLELEKQLEAAELRALENDCPENVNALGELQHRFETLGGYSFRSEAKSIMASLGFRPDDFERETLSFSGGWQMRILLARILLQKPDLLLLDEPTNHLDMESLAWLEGFLQNYPGTVLIVSHDRVFLNRVIEAVASLDSNGLLTFPGNYDHYLELRDQLEEQQEKALAQQKRSIAETQAFIDRFRYKATKAKQVQSRVKQLEKIEEVQVIQRRKKIRFSFPNPERTPQILIELTNVSKSYGDKVVYTGIDFRVYRGDKIAMVAPNGAGKSTLIKILANIIPFTGKRILSDRVEMAHFAQHQIDALDFNKTLLEEAASGLKDIQLTTLRAALGAFLFTNEDMDKRVSVLSGGEKNKLALAKILLRRPNLLLMDEPTNHLDLDSREALEVALQNYTGSIVVISHDRWFIEKICNKVAYIENGKPKIFEGSYFDYERFQQAQKEAEQAAAGVSVSTNQKKQKRVESAQLRNTIRKATKDIDARIKKLESDTHTMEARLKELDAALADPETYKKPDQLKALNQERNALKADLDAKMEAWMEAQMELEDIMAQFED